MMASSIAPPCFMGISSRWFQEGKARHWKVIQYCGARDTGGLSQLSEMRHGGGGERHDKTEERSAASSATRAACGPWFRPKSSSTKLEERCSTGLNRNQRPSVASFRIRRHFEESIFRSQANSLFEALAECFSSLIDPRKNQAQQRR